METGSTMVVRGLGKEGWGAIVTGMEFQSGKMRRVLEMDGGDGCTTMRMDLMTLN